MTEARIISADSHVFEPADLWTNRMSREYRARAPRVIRHETGDWWDCEGRALTSPLAMANPGTRYRQDNEINSGTRFEHAVRGSYDPDARTKDMDLDGISAEFIYPQVALVAFRNILDNGLLDDICRAYNDWLSEFCNAYPARLKGIGIINVDHIPEAVKEMERIRRLGLPGVLISVYPREDRGYDLP